MNIVTLELIKSADEKYKEFSASLIPTEIEFLGVRAPDAKKIAKGYARTKEGEEFMSELPHTYHDEYITHAYMLGFLEQGQILAHLKRLLPYMNSWAVVDTTVGAIKPFFKSRERALGFVLRLIDSSEEFISRFGIVALLSYYLDNEYAIRAIDAVKRIKSDKFYVKMAQAWFFATALTKQYELAIEVIRDGALDAWVHNKSIQKARESLRISRETKEYLKTLRKNGDKK
ncbi:MAG: DNA alkylation repair protein [Clostridia bacterium]|nr:DNA alkylation repair protein [Clostridia bacterium]